MTAVRRPCRMEMLANQQYQLKATVEKVAAAGGRPGAAPAMHGNPTYSPNPAYDDGGHSGASTSRMNH